MSRVRITETGLRFARPLAERAATNFFVIHHIGDCSRDVPAAEIHQWHLNNGWAGIGYHYVIRKDGTIERGRPRWALGSHCYGFNNESIGINVVGNLQESQPTNAQIESLTNLVAELCEIYDFEPNEDTVVGHRDKNSTSCPGDLMYNRLGEVRSKAKELL